MRITENMRVKRTKDGFITFQDNPFVEKVIAHYCEDESVVKGPPIELGNGHFLENTKRVIIKEGRVDVYYYGKDTVSVPVKRVDVYQDQYGFPVSADGTMLYVMNWDINGVIAYEIATGKIAWKYRPGTIRDILVYDSYIVAHKSNTALIKFDWKTGEILGELKSGTMESCHRLPDPYVLTCYRGKESIVDTQTMEIVKQYSKKETGFEADVTYVELQGNQLLLESFGDIRMVDYDL